MEDRGELREKQGQPPFLITVVDSESSPSVNNRKSFIHHRTEHWASWQDRGEAADSVGFVSGVHSEETEPEVQSCLVSYCVKHLYWSERVPSFITEQDRPTFSCWSLLERPVEALWGHLEGVSAELMVLDIKTLETGRTKGRLLPSKLTSLSMLWIWWILLRLVVQVFRSR